MQYTNTLFAKFPWVKHFSFNRFLLWAVYQKITWIINKTIKKLSYTFLFTVKYILNQTKLYSTTFSGHNNLVSHPYWFILRPCKPTGKPDISISIAVYWLLHLEMVWLQNGANTMLPQLYIIFIVVYFIVGII